MIKILLLAPIFLGNLQITSYRSVPEQTDSSPFIAADGHHVHPYGVAVSRDLHQRWGGPLKFGDVLYVEGVGFKVVNDTMNKRHRTAIDVWVKRLKDEQAFHKKWKGKKTSVWLIKRGEKK